MAQISPHLARVVPHLAQVAPHIAQVAQHIAQVSPLFSSGSTAIGSGCTALISAFGSVCTAFTCVTFRRRQPRLFRGLSTTRQASLLRANVNDRFSLDPLHKADVEAPSMVHLLTHPAPHPGIDWRQSPI